MIGEYALTFENGGGKKVIRNLPFESDLKASNFASAYKAVNTKSRVVKITKVVYEDSPVVDDVVGLVNQKIMYETLTKKLCNLVLPFLHNVSRTDLNSMLIHVKDFKSINNVLIDKIV